MNPITLLTIVLWIAFFLGVGLKILSRAGFAIRNPINPVASRWQFVARNWDTLVIRSAWDVVFFVYWLNHPGALSDLLGMAHIPLNFDLPVTHYTAGVFGFLIDYVMDWLGSAAVNSSILPLKYLGMIIGGSIPPLPPMELVAKAHADQTLGNAAADAVDVAKKAADAVADNSEKKG